MLQWSEEINVFSAGSPMMSVYRQGGKSMIWKIDQATALAAMTYMPLQDQDAPVLQFGGCHTSAETWNDRVLQPSTWPNEPLWSSPEEIIKQFADERYTQALALVVSWGGMGRRSKDIYGKRKRDTIVLIDRTLRHCAENIRESKSIADSWRELTGSEGGQLRWSAVMTSKTLHFLCRALEFTQDPPVAIDGAVIRQRLWPAFYSSIPPGQRPGKWDGNSFEAYSRYMTAVLTWARQKNWTTTDIEATIFKNFG